MISLAADHDSVDMRELLMHLSGGVDAAVDHDLKLRKIILELVHELITQGRDFTVFFGRKTLQPGVAGVDDEGLATRLADRSHEITNKPVALALVNANTVLDRDRQAHRIAHGPDTVGHELGLGHQASAKGTALDALARATAIEVDLVVSPVSAKPSRLSQFGRLAAAELQGQRVFFGVEPQMPRHIAMQQRARGHHLGVEQRTAR